MKITSSTPKMKELVRNKHKIDAEGQILGRLAVKTAKILMGKNKAIFTYNENVGDQVIISNIDKIRFTGNKLKDKKYYHHTDYPKGLRSEALESLFNRDPSKVFRKAVSGMLPKNRLRKLMLRNLIIMSSPKNTKEGNS